MKKLTTSSLLSGVAGGLAVLAVGSVLIATGVIASGGTTKTIVQQAPVAAPTTPTSEGGRYTVEDIYKRDAPGVAFVSARIVQQTDSLFGFPQRQQGTATGSGFVLDKRGYILTNAHVVSGSDRITVRFGDSRPVVARLVGTDPSTDLAVLKVDPGTVKLVPLPLGDSGKVRVGDPAIAIGNPFGYDRTVTTGIVSALQREIKAPNGFTINNVIQTDASINPGNSGGPLLDGAGRVIGINSQIATGGNGNGSVGIGFAIPINTAKSVVSQLIDKGKVAHAYLGISTAEITPSLARDLNLPTDRGALVQQVVKGGPAAKAGLRAGDTQTDSGLVIGGDLIVKVDGKEIQKPEDVASAISSHKPGDEVEVQYYRGGKLRSSKVKLGNRPADFPAQQPQGNPGGGDVPFPLP
ncbi:MAG: trypsin-like peptidase domain-containing protein [Thermoleophilaceae bacterium]|nr:trypsin-like peptidase domain-containing protein [Thermoleophilaceae bacterium]